MNNDRLIAKQTLTAVPHVARRKPLAAAILAASLAGCGSDSNNSFTFEPQPTFVVSNPQGSISTLTSDVQFNLTMLAQDPFSFLQGPELLIESVAVTNTIQAIDQPADSSANVIEVISYDFTEPPNELRGNGNNFLQDTLSGEFLVGGNVFTFSAGFDQGRSVDEFLTVVSGSSWMKESSIAFDTAGNLYALDQIGDPDEVLVNASILNVDLVTGAKTVENTLDGLVDPVDFIIRNGTAYVLDGRSGLHVVEDFANNNPAPSDFFDCSASEQLVDPVAFDIDFDASGNPVRYFVADRGLKELIEIDAAGGCSSLPAADVEIDDPISEDESDTILVPGLILDLPVDIAYHDTSETLFVSGGWVQFASVAETVLDASGNSVLDSSGNELQQAVTQSGRLAEVLVAIDLTDVGSDYERQIVSFRAQEQLDASGNTIPDPDASGNLLEDDFFTVLAPGRLQVRGNDLFVVEEFLADTGIGAPGVLAMDVTDVDPEGSYIARAVSGGVIGAVGFSEGSDNPDNQIPFSTIDALALNDADDQLFTLSQNLGSYIYVDLSEPTGCIAVDDLVDGEEVPDDAVLQCEFSGVRTLIAGGATVAGEDPDGSEGEFDDGYERTSRALADTRRFSAAVYSGTSLLAWNNDLGTPSQDFLNTTFDFTDEDTSLDQLLVAEGTALALNGSSVLAVDMRNDRLVSFTSNTRTLVSDTDAGSLKFDDPIASAARSTRDASGNFDQNFLYVVDAANGLIEVNLSGEVDSDGEIVIEPGIRRNVNISDCDLSDATAAEFVGLVSDDQDDDGEAEDSGFFERLATLFVSKTSGALIAIDLLTEECTTVSGITLPADVVAISVDSIIDTEVSEDGDDETPDPVSTRSFSMMFLGAANELLEIECEYEVLNGAGLSCTERGVYAIAGDQPISPAAMFMDWTFTAARFRQASIFDDVLNSVFTVDLVPRDGNGAPLQIDDVGASDTVTGQTFITGRGLPFNCDPANDAEACKNL